MTYAAAHSRVRAVRGPAREHACPCGDRADEWAYSHSGISERSEVRRNSVVPFSDDPWQYQALCTPCHRRADRNRATHCPSGHDWADNEIRYPSGQRHCRTCRDARNRARHEGGPGKGSNHSMKTHCPQGHPYSGANLIVPSEPGRAHRRCRACRDAAYRRRRNTQ